MQEGETSNLIDITLRYLYEHQIMDNFLFICMRNAQAHHTI